MYQSIEDRLDEELSEYILGTHESFKNLSNEDRFASSPLVDQNDDEINDESSSDTIEPYEPPDSLWQLIKSVTNEKELDVIKRIIGESLVETSIDLHNEIDTLLEIWQDFRNETMSSLNQLKQSMNKSNSNLPEPPNIRETLKKEIQFFVKQLREKFKEDEKFCNKILTNNHNLNVINYVLNSTQALPNTMTSEVYDMNRRTKTRSTSLSSTTNGSIIIEKPKSVVHKSLRGLTETPATGKRESRQRVRYRSVSRCSTATGFNSPTRTLTSLSNYDSQQPQATLQSRVDEIEVDEDKINFSQIDEIADRLRELLQKECDQLLSDIDFLYECIYKEEDYRSKSRLILREPTLNELKEERKRLEADLLSNDKSNVNISKLPATNNRLKSPILSMKHVTPSPPTSAGSVRSQKSIISANNINLSTPPSTVTTHQVNKKKLSLEPNSSVTTSKRSSSLKRNSSINNERKKANSHHATPMIATISSNTNSNIATNPVSSTTSAKTTTVDETLIANLKPVLTRTNSVNSIASSVDSTTSSSLTSPTSSRMNTAQRFRQMVINSRNP